ncbi:37S ribosomal protein MRP4, mitochondrial [Fonsecaea nubica]|uniref:37S ribosomal protein MRP4, mitochondrial n=1 Tax=Fonsecaea nubica TaxID=856822 RepID=A0A178DB15_9EURO|nr:37S ribosomal protein MRP4, mitochondrial [Fonsecaea nubica]OAL38441.1 37S ribosomal protein MRP4, mitochondrial [Fonsecaea nubica]
MASYQRVVNGTKCCYNIVKTSYVWHVSAVDTSSSGKTAHTDGNRAPLSDQLRSQRFMPTIYQRRHCLTFYILLLSPVTEEQEMAYSYVRADKQSRPGRSCFRDIYILTALISHPASSLAISLVILPAIGVRDDPGGRFDL